jgi:hypothetical protein
LSALLGLACAAMVPDAGDGVGRTHDVSSPEGAAELALEEKRDPSLRGYVAANGKPQYLLVVGTQQVYLYYTEKDQVILFERRFLERSEVKRIPRTPGSLLKHLPESEQAALRARREEKKSRAAARRPRPRAASPASPSPGWDDRRFDVNGVVKRLRTPLTAADRGVGGWKSETLSDGSLRSATRFAGATFDVRSNRITLSAPIANRAVRTPEAVRTGLVRVNAAVFGPNAASVSRFVTTEAGRVSADPSGRTQVARRVAGRTVRIVRVPANGVIVYTVTP